MDLDKLEFPRSPDWQSGQFRLYCRLVQFRLIYPEVFRFKGIKQIGLRSTLNTFRAGIIAFLAG